MDNKEIMSEDDRLPDIDDIVLSARNKAYKLISVIGEGGYGSVFMARCENDERFFFSFGFKILQVNIILENLK